MPFRTFKPHRARDKSKPGWRRWRVIRPKDLRREGLRVRNYFGSRSEAQAFVKELQRSRFGDQDDALPEKEKRAVSQLLKEFSCMEIITATKDYRERKTKKRKPVSDLAGEYLADQEKHLRDNSYAVLKISLASFCKACDKTIDEITPDDVRLWLKNARTKAGNPVSAWTTKGLLKDVSGMFNFAKNNGLIPLNPCAAVKSPKIEHKAAKIFTVDECRRILDYCWEHDAALLGYIVPILFLGLRPDESRRMKPEFVKHGNIFDLPGDSAKLAGRRVIHINATAAAWLANSEVQFGNFVNLGRRMDKLRKAAAITWSKDVLRHSFCSYSLPIHGVNETAKNAGNSETIIYKHYREIVSKEDAERFWGLRPGSG